MLASSFHACSANYFFLNTILNFSIASDVQKSSTHISRRTAERKIENSDVKHKENKDTKNQEKSFTNAKKVFGGNILMIAEDWNV